MQGKETVCAVVVTYNRKEFLIECLEALENQSKQLDAIYIIDNASSDETQELLFQKGYIGIIFSEEMKEPCERTLRKDKIIIHYLRMQKNVGGSGGFHEGVKRAVKREYDWVWLMDDDAKPEIDALEKLENYYKDSNNMVFACIVKDKARVIQREHRGYLNFDRPFTEVIGPLQKEDIHNLTMEIDFASFVGLLINKEAIKKVGFPKKEFFIRNDDLEYCIRLRKISKIILIMNSIIFHEEIFMDINKKGRVEYENLWRTFYGKRNIIWITRRNTSNKFLFYYTIIKNYIMNFGGVILFDDNKIRRLIFLTECYKDGLRGNFDNNKPQKILNKD